MARARRSVTLEQVAAAAGVSRQTVSNALNAPERLHQDTLRRISAVIDQLGYRPNRSARSLRTRRSGMIGYSMTPRPPHVLTPITDDFLHALCAAADAQGQHILLFTTPPGEAGLALYEDLLAQRAVDAFVIADVVVGDPRHAWLAAHGVPFASFGRTWQGTQPGPWVDVDNADGTRQLVTHLAEVGHRRIAFLRGPEHDGVGNDRLRGWRDACAERGLPAGEGLVFRCERQSVEGGRETAAAALDAAEPPTALVAENDAMAIGALQVLTERGLTPGGDVAVTGFDDSPVAAATLPGLTSVRQPVQEAARQAIRLLETTTPPSGGVLLQPALVVRASSGGAAGT